MQKIKFYFNFFLSALDNNNKQKINKLFNLKHHQHVMLMFDNYENIMKTQKKSRAKYPTHIKI